MTLRFAVPALFILGMAVGCGGNGGRPSPPIPDNQTDGGSDGAGGDAACNSVSACGDSCAACDAPANGTAFCGEGKCGFTCNAGYQTCGSGCCLEGALSASNKRTCAVTSAGAAQCWGDNTYGELGDNSRTDSNVPVQVSGLQSGVVAVATGDLHTCALTNAGAVKCWGNNGYGQLGQGTNTGGSLVPIAVPGLSTEVIAISANSFFTLALKADGTVRWWGRDVLDTLGNSAVRPSPLTILGLNHVKQLAAGDLASCALTSDGAVKCWGLSRSGELGTAVAAGTHTLSPVTIAGLPANVSAIAAGYESVCALAGGAVYCWGDNTYGQLGNGSSAASSATPVTVTGLDAGVTAIAAAGYHFCALTSDNKVSCWGDNSLGQIGDGTTMQRRTPVVVTQIPSIAVGTDEFNHNVAYLVGGQDHTCALDPGMHVTCWGWNDAGQIGDGTLTQRLTPVGVTGL